MRNTGCDTTKTHVFHYPVILSRVFQAFSVDFIGERQKTIGHPHIITFNTFHNYGYA